MRVVEDGEVDLPAMQPVEQVAGVGADQAQLDLRVRPSERRDQGNRDDVGNRRRKADADPAAQGCVEVGGRGADLLQLDHDPRGVLEDLATLVRQDHAAAVAGEQAHGELFFQHPDLAAEGRLGDAQRSAALLRLPSSATWIRVRSWESSMELIQYRYI